MKRSIPVFWAALLLAAALSACGSETDDLLTPDNGAIEDPILPDQDAPLTPGEDDPAPDGGVPLDEMLENAYVHDTDGDLLDGENAVTPGAAQW